MPESFGMRYWAAAPRPGLYGAHGWPQLFQYLASWCYPNNLVRQKRHVPSG